MDSQQSTASSLKWGLKLGIPLATAVESYLNTNDPTPFTTVPTNVNIWESKFVQTAQDEFGQTPESMACFVAVISRIQASSPKFKDPFSESFCRHIAESHWHPLSQTARCFADLAKSGAYSVLQIAQFWMVHFSRSLDFGWKAEEDQYWNSDLHDIRHFRSQLPEAPDINPIEEMILGLDDNDLVSLLTSYDLVTDRFTRLYLSMHHRWRAGTLHGYIARHRVEVFKAFLKTLKTPQASKAAVDWRYVISATDRFDRECLDYCNKTQIREERTRCLALLSFKRDNRYLKETYAACQDAKEHELSSCLRYLAETAPHEMLSLLSKNVPSGQDVYPESHLTPCYTIAANCWKQGGDQAFRQLHKIDSDPEDYFPDHRLLAAIEGLFHSEIDLECGIVWIRKVLDNHAEYRTYFLEILWQSIVKHQPKLLEDEFWTLLQHKSNPLRRIAKDALASIKNAKTIDRAAALLSDKKLHTRLAAADLLESLSDPTAAPHLQIAIESEKSDKVIAALHAALAKCAGDESVLQRSLEDLEADFEKQAKKLKIPAKATWFDPKALPPLKTTDGESLSDLALTFMVAKQSKHKTMTLAPEIVPLVTHIDRESSDDFAMAILKQWLGSDQAAADRWALVFAGYFGNQRLLPELMVPIQSWAEKSRHKLAEYGVQAIALVPGEEALMVLDSLANRYRSRSQNLGKTCRAALNDAANARGVSLDELADMIAPDLGFDEENERALPETDIRAVLQPDFKLTFYNPETQKETTSPPSTLTDAAKEDLKTLRKLIRETVKGQTARLELSLVRERAWPSKRWSELFENHPILQSFASRLVWRSLDSKGEPRRLFRRYPNGLLADAAGELIELDDKDHRITMVHPLHLDVDTLISWQEHLARMKVKPPFPQLDRPVALLDPDHGNRKTLALANGKELSVGTFRSRAEKRGWIRGSVVDAGGITAYHKSFHEAKVDVILHVEEMWIGQDAQDEMTLGEAYFVRGDSVKTGSYEYDEPSNQDDERILTFASVPPIVYSETVTDLQAIAP